MSIKRAELIDLKKKSTSDKIDFLVDITYDIQESQGNFHEFCQSCSAKVQGQVVEVNEAIYGSHSDPQKGLIPRIGSVEKSRAFWTRLMWVVLGSGTGFMIVYLIKTIIGSVTS